METANAMGLSPNSPAELVRRYTQQLPLSFEPEPLVINRAANPELANRTATFVQALLEVLDGHRSVLQMSQWVTPDVYESLVRRVTLLMKANGSVARRQQLASLHIFSPHPRAAEISARVIQGKRSRAIALRLDLLLDPRGRWQWKCTALVLG